MAHDSRLTKVGNLAAAAAIVVVPPFAMVAQEHWYENGMDVGCDIGFDGNAKHALGIVGPVVKREGQNDLRQNADRTHLEHVD